MGVSDITTATLSIYGRSYNTTTSGSFNWQTFAGVGSAPTNLVSNSAPSSGALVVNRIELCLEAD